MNTDKINLIYNKDLESLLAKGSLSEREWKLVQSVSSNTLETKIQQRCHQLCLNLAFEYEKKLGRKVLEFVQIDNGGRMGFAQHKKKKAEGTKVGMPDSMIFIEGGKTILVEFKRVGTPSSIKITPEQLNYHHWLNAAGFDAYITNNPLFFEEVILGKVKSILDNAKT